MQNQPCVPAGIQPGRMEPMRVVEQEDEHGTDRVDHGLPNVEDDCKEDENESNAAQLSDTEEEVQSSGSEFQPGDESTSEEEFEVQSSGSEFQPGDESTSEEEFSPVGISRDKGERFMLLFDGNWYDRVSASASQSVGRAKMNKPLLLPSVADVEKVNLLLEADSQSESYATLAKATLCAITIFNRKRGGEVQRMKVEDFKVKPKMSHADSELLQGLTESEKRLTHVLQRVEIRGKFNRPVPILLTPGMTENIHRLIQMRSAQKIDSVYLFATPTGENPYRGSDVVRHYATAAGVSEGSLFTATNLRKQLATLSQALAVQKMDQDQLATFLGHDIRIHRNVYRQPLEVMQKTKVASILLKINRDVELPTEISDENITPIVPEDKEKGPSEEEVIPDDGTTTVGGHHTSQEVCE
ncbi:hypothetical protein BaRGS_00024888, partial [Batillaria attramentaria]